MSSNFPPPAPTSVFCVVPKTKFGYIRIRLEESDTFPWPNFLHSYQLQVHLRANCKNQSSFIYILQMDEDEELWKPESWYPPLGPPKSTKKDLLRDEDFTEVDKAAREAPSSLNESFDRLVHHLTSSLNSDLHKLRSIFAWVGAQNIGGQQQNESVCDKNSPKYYFKRDFIDKLFAKMCRVARIPCILVNGQAKGVSYDPGDDDIEVENTWAVVYVAGSWRFVFPYWAFVKVSGHQKGNWMLVEDSGKPTRQRFTANGGVLISDNDEFYFLTDPVEMNCICHPYDDEKQLLTKPWTREMFFTLPNFKRSYFSSGWMLNDECTCVIRTDHGYYVIGFTSPGENSELKSKLFYDEGRSGTKFLQELQTDRYVKCFPSYELPQTISLVLRIPVTGIYKLEVSGIYEGHESSLVHFRVDCDAVSGRGPFPSQKVYGYRKATAEAGITETSHTEGLVPVKSGEEKTFYIKLQEDVEISARLVHFTRKPEELRDNVIIRRDENNATVTARLPADDPEPEYSLEVDTFEMTEGGNGAEKGTTNALNYLLTNDKTLISMMTDKNKQVCKDIYDGLARDDARELEKAACRLSLSGVKNPILEEQIQTKQQRYEQLRENALAAAKKRNFDQLNLALGQCMAVNLQYRVDVETAMDILMELCKEEIDKVLKGAKLQDLRECLNKMSKICVGEALHKKAWFQNVLQTQRDLESFEDSKQKMQPETDDDLANVYKPPDQVVDIIVATFVLLGESKTDLNTWQNMWAKLQKTNECQIFARMGHFDDSVLTQEQVDEAVKRLKKHEGSFDDNIIAKTLHEWCSDRIKFYRLREKLNRRI